MFIDGLQMINNLTIGNTLQNIFSLLVLGSINQLIHSLQLCMLFFERTAGCLRIQISDSNSSMSRLNAKENKEISLLLVSSFNKVVTLSIISSVSCLNLEYALTII